MKPPIYEWQVNTGSHRTARLVFGWRSLPSLVKRMVCSRRTPNACAALCAGADNSSNVCGEKAVGANLAILVANRVCGTDV